MLGLARRWGLLRKRGGFPDNGIQLFVWRKIAKTGQASELTHGSGLGRFSADLLSTPEVEGGMLLECGHYQQNLAVEGEPWGAPLHHFVYFGHYRVDAFADLVEDRACERLGVGDISIDARFAAHNMPPPSMSRTTPTTITSRLRFRPAVPREIMPTPAPMIAKGTISQFAQPSSGMKATIAQISAT